MDTQLLTAFVVTAELHSFSLAAEQLGLTQSAISKRIQLLEKQTQQNLFDRIGRRIELTESGQWLLPRAKSIINQLNDAQRFLEQQRGLYSGTLKIATSHHIGLHRLPPILKSYTQRYPDVHLQLHFIDSELAHDAILQGEFDLAIITLPEKDDSYKKGLEKKNKKQKEKARKEVHEKTDAIKNTAEAPIQSHVLWTDPMSIVVNKQNPLLSKPIITAAELSGHPAILPDRSTRTTQLVSDLFNKHQQTLNISMTTNHLDAIKMMVSVGLGWSALPNSLLDEQLQALPTKGISLSRELGCIHHRERTLSNAARAMLKCLQESETNQKS